MNRIAAIVAGSIALAGLAGCPTIDLGEDPSNPALCRPDPAYFRDQIWNDYITIGGAQSEDSCIRAGGCHAEADGRSGLRLDATEPIDLERNYQVVIRFLNCSARDSSSFLTRPLAGEDQHGGGDLFSTSDPQYATFQGWFP